MCCSQPIAEHFALVTLCYLVIVGIRAATNCKLNIYNITIWGFDCWSDKTNLKVIC